MVGARIKVMYEAGKRERDQSGKFATMAKHGGKAREQAAAVVNVSPRSVQCAVTVLEKGTAHLIAAVDHGRIPVSVAVKVAAEEESIQNSLVAMVEDDGARPHEIISELR